MCFRFGPNLPAASSSTVAFGHARHSAAAYVPRCSLVCCEQRCGFATAPEGEKMLCWAWHRARCRWGYKKSTTTSIWGSALQRRTQPYLDAPSYPAPLTAQKRLFDDVLQQWRICFFLVLYCSREKVQFLILRSDDDRLRRTVGRVNRILNKNRHLSF